MQDSPVRTERGSTPWIRPVLFVGSTGSAFFLYLSTMAPGLTWAHHGADGGELLAAAMVNGVAHPPGYPIYTLLLRTWLTAIGSIAPWSDLAWRGNLLSASLSALGVGLTVLVAGHILRGLRLWWVWALTAAMAWAISTLPWSQALITEVYALHVLAFVLLGWAVLVHPEKPWLLIPIVMLGIANHLTFVLLLPAALTYCWSISRSATESRALQTVLAMLIGTLLGLVIYLRIPIAAGGNGTPPPVNWGYADNWRGFWWLISGSAYRAYLSSLSWSTAVSVLALWASTLSIQLTPIGLGFGLWGLAMWDKHWPQLRTFSLLWVAPVSLYTLVYFTDDREVYLLPVVWMLSFWFATGLHAAASWQPVKKVVRTEPLFAGIAVMTLLLLTAVRAPTVSAATDQEAQTFLVEALQEIQPASIVVTSADAPTFALWYAAWATSALEQRAPDVVLVNHALYQFDWYRRLLGDLYPHVPAVDESVEALIEANLDSRPIYFSQAFSFVPEEDLAPAGPLWRYDRSQAQP